MPRLEEDLASDLMHRAGHPGPCIRVLLVIHHRRIGPFSTVRADECALGNDKSGAILRSTHVVLDAGIGGLAVIDATVPRHGAHADAVAEVDIVPKDNWFEKNV